MRVRVPPISIRTHLRMLVLSALVPMLVLGTVFITWLAAEHRREVDHGLGETARALALAVDHEIMASFAALQGLASSQSLEAGDIRDSMSAPSWRCASTPTGPMSP